MTPKTLGSFSLFQSQNLEASAAYLKFYVVGNFLRNNISVARTISDPLVLKYLYSRRLQIQYKSVDSHSLTNNSSKCCQIHKDRVYSVFFIYIYIVAFLLNCTIFISAFLKICHLNVPLRNRIHVLLQPHIYFISYRLQSFLSYLR